MRKISLALLLLLLALPGMLPAGDAENAGTEARDIELEKQLIEKAARDYIDGWYEGNEERMQRALHPDLAKRRVDFLPNERAILSTVSADAMVEYTRLGIGKKSHREGQVNEVTILDVSAYTASVKTVSHQFIDYLHLAKMNGEWRIINVLWEPAKAASE